MFQVMLDQKNNPKLDDKWLDDDEQLKCYIIDREKILGRVKGSEIPPFKGYKYYHYYLVVRVRVTSRT